MESKYIPDDQDMPNSCIAKGLIADLADEKDWCFDNFILGRFMESTRPTTSCSTRSSCSYEDPDFLNKLNKIFNN